jgi:hypothetical protein
MSRSIPRATFVIAVVALASAATAVVEMSRAQDRQQPPYLQANGTMVSPVSGKRLPGHPSHHSRAFTEGRTSPESIPEDLAYRTFFRTLLRLRAQGNEARLAAYISFALRMGVRLRNDQSPTGDHFAQADDLRAHKRSVLDFVTRHQIDDGADSLSPAVASMRSNMHAELGGNVAGMIDSFVLKHVRRQLKLIN